MGQSNTMKNIIILKELPSNLVEEAIIVVKDYKKIKNWDGIQKVKEGGEIFSDKTSKAKAEKALMKSEEIQSFEKLKKEERQYVVKEAETVVSNYISKIENKDNIKTKNVKKLEKKYQNSKLLNIVFGIFSITSMIMMFLK